MKAWNILTLTLGFVVLASYASADVLEGKLAPNATIIIKPINVTTQTDRKGKYKIDLPAGTYTVILHGKRCPVRVRGRTRFDGC